MVHKHAAFLRKSAEPFWDHLDHWYSELPIVSLKSLLKEYRPEETALVIVDVTNAFCKEGNLASSRVARIVPHVVELVQHAERMGINHYLLPQDSHPEHSLEFDIYPPHSQEGSEESKTVDELQQLPNAYKFKVFPKNSINPGTSNDLMAWLDQNQDVRQFIVTGDCTDICVHQMAMLLMARSVSMNIRSRVLVPANCVDTFDFPVHASEKNAPPPHPGDVMHCLFLYHMYLNGIRIVAGIE